MRQISGNTSDWPTRDLLTKRRIGSRKADGTPVSGQNAYTSINTVLDKLGINASPVKDHHHHFHVYLRPPELLEIDTASNLLTDAVYGATVDTTTTASLQTEAQGLLDYAQTLIEGEELMFIMDVPYVPAQEAPIVLLTQADASGVTTQPDYLLKICQETESTGDPASAIRGVDPVGWLRAYIGNRDHRVIDSASSAAIKPILLEGTTHGKLNRHVAPNGQVYFMYDPIPEYIGNDKAVFMAEFEGKRYKIVVELHVFIGVDENSSTCSEPQLIKVTKPSSGASSYGSDYYDLSSVTVTFDDLPGAAVGQTFGSNITLDTNAAGHNWYIDSNLWDNSEYLPTSNPNKLGVRGTSGSDHVFCLQGPY